MAAPDGNETATPQGAADVLRADISRLKAEIGNLASDAVRLPKDAMVGSFEDRVRREPVKAVAIAVGVGALIGIILAR